MGQCLDLVIPRQFRASHWAGYERAMATGESKYGWQLLPTRSMRKDGTGTYLELALAIVRDEANLVVGALAIARDITERRDRERAVRNRLADLERQVTILFQGRDVP